MLKKLFAILALACALAVTGLGQNSNSSTTTRTNRTPPKTTAKKPTTTATESDAQQTDETGGQKASAPAKRTPAKTAPTTKDVLATFNALLEGIRHTDVNAVTGAYWNSPQLSVFNNNGTVTRGWEQVRSNRQSLYAKAGLPEPRLTWYRLESEMEALIARSFPNPGDDDKIRAIFRASLADDALGIQTRLVDGKIHYGFPVAVMVADR